MKRIHKSNEGVKGVIHKLAVAKHINMIQEERNLKPKIKRMSLVLSILLILDVVSTLLLLNLVPSASEMNPFLNMFSNIQIGIIFSHIFALIVVHYMNKKLMTDSLELKRFGYLSLRIVSFFYSIIVTSNFMQLFYWLVFI